jgi:outer membrane protein, heavy metal efflux system
MVRTAMVAALIATCATGHVFALTLDESVATGLGNNPELRAFRLEEEVVRGQLAKAKLPPFSNPMIDGSMSTQGRSPGTPGGAFRNNQISLSQSVEIAGQRGLRIDVATHNLERARLDIRDLARTLRADIKNAFAQALFAHDREALTREYLRLQEDLSNLVSVKYQAGDVAALEVNLSQVELARAQRDVIAASTEYRNALLSLGRLIGLPGGALPTVEGELATGLPPLPEREALLARIGGRPDVKAAETETKRSEVTERLIGRETIPNVVWSVFQGRTEGGDERGATLGVSIPLFDRRQGERIEARARLSQARIREISVTRTAQKEIEESYAAAASSLQELDLFKRAILERIAENLNLLQLAFKEGKISFYDVRIAQRETIETRNAYLQALLSAQRAYNALERAAGEELR